MSARSFGDLWARHNDIAAALCAHDGHTWGTDEDVDDRYMDLASVALLAMEGSEGTYPTAAAMRGRP